MILHNWFSTTTCVSIKRWAILWLLESSTALKRLKWWLFAYLFTFKWKLIFIIHVSLETVFFSNWSCFHHFWISLWKIRKPTEWIILLVVLILMKVYVVWNRIELIRLTKLIEDAVRATYHLCWNASLHLHSA